MGKSPWKRIPPRQKVDWPITILITGAVVAAAVIVGLAFSSMLYP